MQDISETVTVVAVNPENGDRADITIEFVDLRRDDIPSGFHKGWIIAGEAR